jgi:hypothetical protein
MNVAFGNSGRLLLAFLLPHSPKSVADRMFPHLPCFLASRISISNKPTFHLKHPGVPDGSDGSDGTSYPLTDNYMLPVAYSPQLLYAWYTHHQNDTCVTLFAGAAVML